MHILLLACACALPTDEKKPTEPRGDDALPASWLGLWQGTLKIEAASGPTQSLPMELRFMPLKTGRGVAWRLTYGKGPKAQVRDYELLVQEKENHFLMDEKNGLLLDYTRRGDTLYTQFRVNEKLITARYAWDGDKLHVAMTVASLQAPRKSKLNTGKAEVESYRLETTQSAILTKIAD